jgi:LPXTG-site transpeptidase (sortase) family protein
MNKKYIGYMLILIGISGIAISAKLYLSVITAPKRLSIGNTVAVEPEPSAVKQTQAAVASYTVPASNPKYISIPDINISNTPILKLGLSSDGSIATPDNIYETGWYDGSALPGQPGAMFIYGHVSSWQADGTFYNLKKLQTGDQIIIIRGDDTQLRYQVISTVVYPYNAVNMNRVLASINPNRPGLNLMTCTGQVIKGTSEFNERLVVFASLIN